MLDKLARAIETANLPSGIATKLVMIDGGGGAGKTTLAHRLAGALDGAPVVQADDFMDGPHPAVDWWHRLRDQVIVPLAQGHAARYQRYDWGAHAWAEWHDLAPGGTTIIEGVSSLRREFRPYIAYSIWIDTPADIRLERGLNRDGGIFGLEQWREWQEWDQDYYDRDRPDKVADVIIDGTKKYL